jgi:hypothetical protein
VFTSTSDPSVVAARAWSWWQQDFFKLITQSKNHPSHPTKKKKPKKSPNCSECEVCLVNLQKVWGRRRIFLSHMQSFKYVYKYFLCFIKFTNSTHSCVLPINCIFTSVRLNKTLWSTFCLFVCSSGTTWPFWESFFLWVVFLSK